MFSSLGLLLATALFGSYLILVQSEGLVLLDKPYEGAHTLLWQYPLKSIDVNATVREDHWAEDFAALNVDPNELADVRFHYMRYILLRHFASITHDAGGCYDVDTLIPIMSAIWSELNSTQKGSYAFLDGGANVGHTTAKIMAAFSPIASCKYFSGSEVCKECYRTGEPMPRYFSVEPVPFLVKKILSRATQEGWVDFGWEMVPKAITQVSGEVPMFFGTEAQEELYEQGSMDPYAALFQNPQSAQPTIIPGVSIDDFVFAPGSSVGSRRFFALKIDLEGYDYEGLLGARRTLEEKRAKFVVFEQNLKAYTSGRKHSGFHDIVNYLDDLDYFCFYIHKDYLLPITGRWWFVIYERVLLKTWANVFCGPKGDRDVLRIYMWFAASDNEVQRETAQSLQAAGLSLDTDVLPMLMKDLKLAQ